MELWLIKGILILCNLFLLYLKGVLLILNRINLCIIDKEKVGVVGCIGVGKLLLVVVLFRILELEGEVRICRVLLLGKF